MNIPDQVSHDDLKKLLEVPDNKPEMDDNEPMFDGYTTAELVSLCQDAKDAVAEKCKHPMAHKVLAMLIIEHFIEFHCDVGARHMDDGCDRALVWAKDVGKLLAVKRLFADVGFGPDDWFVNWDFEDHSDDICPECQGDS